MSRNRNLWSDDKVEKLISLRGIKYADLYENTTTEGTSTGNIEIWKKIKEELGMETSIECLMNKWEYLMRKYNSWKRFKKIKTSIFDEFEENETQIKSTWKFYDLIDSILNNHSNSSDIIVQNEIMTKCGDVKVSPSFKVVLECTFCSKISDKFNEFCNHLKEMHLSQISLSNISESEEDIQGETSRSCSFEENNNRIFELPQNLFEELKQNDFEVNLDVLSEIQNESNYIDSDSENEEPNHEEIKNFQCKICLSRLSQLEHLEKHLKNVHNISADSEIAVLLPKKENTGVTTTQTGKEYKCEFCFKTFTQIKSLRKHIIEFHINGYSSKHESTDEIPNEIHQCDLCCAQFPHPQYIKYHMRIVHPQLKNFAVCNCPNEKHFICKKCVSFFQTKENCDEHEEFCTGKEPVKRYSCDLCGKCFLKETSYNIHLNSHKGIKSFKCHLCQKLFTKPGNLKIHIRRHLNERNHQCSYCDRKFITSSAKIVHERCHTGERPYQCTECGRCFIASGALAMHTKKHKGEKNHHCKFCDMAFYTPENLNIHMTKHTKIKNFICEICNTKFARRSNMLEHKKLHSDVGTHSCKICGKLFKQYIGLSTHYKKTHKLA